MAIDFDKRYGVPESYLAEQVRSSGGNWDVTKLVLEGLPYDSFREKYLSLLRDEFVNREDDSDVYRPDRMFSKIDNDEFVSTEEYDIMVTESNTFIYNMATLYKNPKETTNRFPIESIMNGNFFQDTLFKQNLTPELRKELNVHGLTDDLFDIYIDETRGSVIPIYYDKATKNEEWYNFTTFLDKYYKSENLVGNHLTPLLLFDRDLMGIDTDMVNDPLMMQKVVSEGRRNIYYHAREVAKNPAANGQPRSRYGLTVASWSFLWNYAQNKNTFRQQSRQTGKTYDMGHALAYEFSYGSTNCSIGSFHYQYSNAAENRRTWVGYANEFPSYIQIHNITTKVSKGKSYEIMSPEPMMPSSAKITDNKKLKNKFLAIAIGTSKLKAEQAGRGSSLRFIGGDEINFIKYIKLAFTALMFAHSTARNLADKAGLRTGIHFASTAGTLDSEQGRIMHRFIFEDMIEFDPKMLVLNFKEYTDLINSRSKNRFVFLNYSYKEIGLSEAWLDERIAGKDVAETRTEMLNAWLATNRGGLFKLDAIARIDEFVSDNPVKTFLFNKLNTIRFPARFESFEDMIRNVGVLSIGIDFALGDLGDYTSLTGVDLLTGERVLDFDDNNMDIPDASTFIIRLTEYMISIKKDLKLLLVPEVDGPGKAVIPSLKKSDITEKYIFRRVRVLNKEITDLNVRSTNYDLTTKTRMEYGTVMRHIRDTLFNLVLFHLVDNYHYIFNDAKTADELKTLMKNTRGKILAKSGFHDDKVVSTLHAISPLFVPEYNEALSSLFDIHISVSNLVARPLTSTVSNIREPEVAKEGVLSWVISARRDEVTNLYYDHIDVYRIRKGIRVALTREEIVLESIENKELEIAVLNMRSRATISSQSLSNPIARSGNQHNMNKMSMNEKLRKGGMISSSGNMISKRR